MTELEEVTEGPAILVTVQDMEDSEFGGLLQHRKVILNTERRDVVIGDWIKRAKLELLYRTSRTEDYLVSSEQLENMARTTIILMVGRIILKRGQIARVEYTETDYIRMMLENQEEIDNNIKNLKAMSSPITITHAEPHLLDPDEDYPEDTA